MNDVQKYLETITPEQKQHYNRIAKVVHSLTPGVQETISYAMPTFKLNGKILLHFGAFKNHMSLFPAGDQLPELTEKLKPFHTAKGTLQFTNERPITDELVAEIIKDRLKHL